MSILPLALQELAFDKLSFEFCYTDVTGKPIELSTEQWDTVRTEIDRRVDEYVDLVLKQVITKLEKERG